MSESIIIALLTVTSGIVCAYINYRGSIRAAFIEKGLVTFPVEQQQKIERHSLLTGIAAALIAIFLIMLAYWLYNNFVGNNIVNLDNVYKYIYPAYGQDDPTNIEGGTGKFYAERTRPDDISYKFEYNLTAKVDSYASLIFVLSEPMDLTQFKSLVITLRKDDNDANCQVNLKDKNGSVHYVRICDRSFEGGTEGDVSQSSADGEFTVTLPLALNFTSLDKRKITEIAFGVSGNFTNGKHGFTIHEVHFVK